MRVCVYHLPYVEITRVSPRDYPVNLALARANNSSALAIDFDISANVALNYARNCRVHISEMSSLLFVVTFNNIAHKAKSVQIVW